MADALSGLFPIHGRGPSGDCDTGKVEWDGIFALEAFYLSLDAANAGLLLPKAGFTLGAVAEDTCFNEKRGLVKALKFVIKYLVPEKGTGDITDPASHDVIGVVGPMSSDVSIQVWDDPMRL